MAYRMRFRWPDEIDADQAHYQQLLEKWGSDEAIDDMEHAFGSLFWQMPERVPCVVTLEAQTGQEALRRPPRDGSGTPGSTAAWVISSSIAGLRIA